MNLDELKSRRNGFAGDDAAFLKFDNEVVPFALPPVPVTAMQLLAVLKDKSPIDAANALAYTSGRRSGEDRDTTQDDLDALTNLDAAEKLKRDLAAQYAADLAKIEEAVTAPTDMPATIEEL